MSSKDDHQIKTPPLKVVFLFGMFVTMDTNMRESVFGE